MKSPTLTFVEAIILSGIVYGVFISFRLFWTSARHRYNFYLGVLMLSFSLINWRVLLTISAFDDHFHWLALSSPVTILAIMPSVYLYLSTVLKAERDTGDWLHYLPFFVHLAYQSIRFFPGSWKDIWHEQGYFLVVSYILSFIFIAQIVYYSFRIFPLLRSVEKLLRMKHSDIEKISLRWLRSLYFACIGVFLIWLAGMSFSSFFMTRIAEFSILFVAISVLVYWIGTHGIMKGFVYQQLSKNTAVDILSEEENLQAKKLFERLKADELFLMPQLQVQDVADRYDLHPKQVSSLLNKGFDKNFYQLINELRVEYFCQHIEKAEQLSLLGLAMQCGFHSKSVFNRFFKEHMKMTPRQYRNQQKKRS